MKKKETTYEYDQSVKLRKYPIESLLMAAIAKADVAYLEPLKKGFPDLVKEVKENL